MERKLSAINIAMMYLGAILGAGFASGRECWQFFGVFGRKGYFGAVFTTVVFVVLALILSYIARSKNTMDLGKLISPFDNYALESAIGYILAGIYYTLIISMSAAGGSLLHQELGIDRRIGGILLVVLVLLTVFGDFERLTFAAEIMGRRANIILIDGEGKIIDSIKRVNPEMSSVRPVLPGMDYTLPPKSPRANLEELDFDVLRKMLAMYERKRLSNALVQTLEGISPVFADEAVWRACGEDKAVCDVSDEEFARLENWLKAESDKLRGGEHNDTLAEPAGRTVTNHAGGIVGGITNGNPIVVRVAIKPTASISTPQINLNTETGTPEK